MPSESRKQQQVVAVRMLPEFYAQLERFAHDLDMTPGQFLRFLAEREFAAKPHAKHKKRKHANAADLDRLYKELVQANRLRNQIAHHLNAFLPVSPTEIFKSDAAIERAANAITDFLNHA